MKPKFHSKQKRKRQTYEAQLRILSCSHTCSFIPKKIWRHNKFPKHLYKLFLHPIVRCDIRLFISVVVVVWLLSSFFGSVMMLMQCILHAEQCVLYTNRMNYDTVV